MALEEKVERLLVVGSAATGYLMCESFGQMHKYAEDLMKGPILTSSFGNREFAASLREKAKPDFIAAIKAVNEELAQEDDG